MKKNILFFTIIFFSFLAIKPAYAHLPRIVKGNQILVQNPEISQAFYAELDGAPTEYIIESFKDFDLYINILVPLSSNPKGRYSANIFKIKNNKKELIAFVDAGGTDWEIFWESFGRDYYLKGPEFEKTVPAGSYQIIISGNNNQGKYVLAIGKTEKFSLGEILKFYLILPKLKKDFFNTPVSEFFKTPFVIFGAMAIVVFITVVGSIFYLIHKVIKKSRPKSILD